VTIAGRGWLAIALLAASGLAAAQKSKCAVTEKMLLGAWSNVSGGFFQEMAFEKDGTRGVFNSWLHQRPEISGGSWSVEDCVVHIAHRDPSQMKLEYKLVRIKGDRLYLRDAGRGAQAVYKRVP